MKTMYSLFLICSGVLFLTSCSSVVVRQSNPALVNPEKNTTLGQLNAAVEVGGSETYELSSDASNRPPNVVPEIIDKKSEIRGLLKYSFTEKFQVSAGLTHFFGINLLAKYNLIGDTQNSFSLALYGLANHDLTTKNGDQSGTFGAGGYPWKAAGRSMLTVAGVSLGYRFSETFLLFVNQAAIGRARLNVKIEQDAANGDQGGVYTESTDAQLLNSGLGFVLGQQQPLTVGVTYTEKRWPEQHLGRVYNTTFELRFGY